ncbi:hypothetical protein Tco_0172465 [Tanacetum coccineum]|uniref:Uncharacterized protein n=1 Tax=Tanacetum coccineum TaxID=301880 RepID=A0ABQ4YMX7_9ASTR
MTTAGTRAVVNIGKGKMDNDLKNSRAIQKAFYKIMQWAWLKSVQRLSMKEEIGKEESIFKQGRKKSKPKSTLDDSTVFDDQDADHGIEYKETEEAMDEGRQSGKTKEVKLTDDTEVVEDKGSDIDAARQEDSVVEPRTPWNGYLTKRRKTKQKSDKTGHEMEKCVKTKPIKVKVNSEKKSKENI